MFVSIDYYKHVCFLIWSCTSGDTVHPKLLGCTRIRIDNHCTDTTASNVLSEFSYEEFTFGCCSKLLFSINYAFLDVLHILALIKVQFKQQFYWYLKYLKIRAHMSPFLKNFYFF